MIIFSLVLILPCFSYLYFIMRVMLAALDHNFHLFRQTPRLMVDNVATGSIQSVPKSTKQNFTLLITKMVRMRTRMEGSFNLPSNGNTWKYLETDFHPTVISQMYRFPILNIDTRSFSIFKYMSTCLLSFGDVDVTGITRLESNGVPDLEKNRPRMQSSENQVIFQSNYGQSSLTCG